MKNGIYLSAIMIGLLLAKSAHSIVILHDVDDSKYQELAASYSSSVAYTDYCAFTLVDPDWLLTAAHCMTGERKVPFDVLHMGNRYRLNKVVINPEFDVANDELHDVALVQLKDAIHNGRQASLYAEKDEQGLQVVFVGSGATGDGDVGLVRADEIERAATNTIVETTYEHLVFRFDSPETATPLEGISGPADSGGPAFIERNGVRYVAGISGFQDRNGYEQARYNVLEYYSRVSTNVDWIQTVLEETPTVAQITHPLLDAVRVNDAQALGRAIREIGDQPLDEEVTGEVYYQTVYLNRVDLAQRLIRAGVSFLTISLNDQSLFEFALTRGRTEYFDMLRNETQDLSGVHAGDSNVFPLMVQRFRREPDVLKRAQRLFQQEADLNARTSDGDTALILVGWATNNLAFIKWLVENGADADIANSNGDTPLMDAARLGKTEIFQYLLSQGANPSLTNNGGVTALDIARARGREDIVEILEGL